MRSNIRRLKKERERRIDIMISITWQMFRGLSESHTSHSITRNTLLLPNFAQNNQPKHSPWLILVHQLRPSVMLKKTRQQKTPFSDLGDHSHHWLHLLMTRFVFCHQISLAKQEERKKDKKNEKKKKEMTRGRKWFFLYEKFLSKNKRSEEIEKKRNKWKRTKRVKERHRKEMRDEERRKKGERWTDATSVPRPRSRQLNAHRLHSLNYVTTRFIGQESLPSRANNSCLNYSPSHHK